MAVAGERERLAMRLATDGASPATQLS